jgi:hypothetical protein
MKNTRIPHKTKVAMSYKPKEHLPRLPDGTKTGLQTGLIQD